MRASRWVIPARGARQRPAVRSRPKRPEGCSGATSRAPRRRRPLLPGRRVMRTTGIFSTRHSQPRDSHAPIYSGRLPRSSYSAITATFSADGDDSSNS